MGTYITQNYYFKWFIIYLYFNTFFGIVFYIALFYKLGVFTALYLIFFLAFLIKVVNKRRYQQNFPI